MNTQTTIRITMNTNATARRLALTVPGVEDLRHNGGRIVIATLSEGDDVTPAMVRALENNRSVVEYVVQPADLA